MSINVFFFLITYKRTYIVVLNIKAEHYKFRCTSRQCCCTLVFPCSFFVTIPSTAMEHIVFSFPIVSRTTACNKKKKKKICDVQ